MYSLATNEVWPVFSRLKFSMEVFQRRALGYNCNWTDVFPEKSRWKCVGKLIGKVGLWLTIWKGGRPEGQGENLGVIENIFDIHQNYARNNYIYLYSLLKKRVSPTRVGWENCERVVYLGGHRVLLHHHHHHHQPSNKRALRQPQRGRESKIQRTIFSLKEHFERKTSPSGSKF